MEIQGTLFKPIPNTKDIVYTPDFVSKQIIEFLNPTGLCLDPCKGDGAFLKYMPKNTDYCELREDRDFFLYNKRVNWVIGNPPYSVFEEFLFYSYICLMSATIQTYHEIQ